MIVLVTMVFAVDAHSTDKEIQAFTGADVTLDCPTEDTTLTDNTGVYWTRSDIKWPNYITFYRGGHLDNDNQDPRYLNRAFMADLKNNNFSLIIRNVSANDSETYECKLFQDYEHQTIKSIKLIVSEKKTDHEADEKKLWLKVGLLVFAVVVLLVALCVFRLKILQAFCSGEPQPGTINELVDRNQV